MKSEDILESSLNITEETNEASDDGSINVTTMTSCDNLESPINCRKFVETKSELQSPVQRLHICNVCKEEFTNSDFIRHMQLHTQQVCAKQKYICNICEEEFTKSTDLQRHKKKVHSKLKKSNIWEICKKIARNSTHRSGEKPDVVIPIKTNFLNCENLCNNYKEFICCFCQKSFSCGSSLKLHYRVHTGERPYVCDWCQKGFVKKHHLQCHERRMHAIHEHIFNVCDEEFTKSTDLKRHRQVHSNGEESNVLEICAKTDLDSTHQAGGKTNVEISPETNVTHDSKKQFVCRFCQKYFSSGAKLRRHYQLHTDEMPYVCELCQKGFVRKCHLQRHEWSLHSIRRLICNVCKETFTERTDFKRHMQQHKKQSRNKQKRICNVCKEEFTNSIGFKRHMQLHKQKLRNSQKRICKVCEEEFTNSIDLKRHKQQVHSKSKANIWEICKKRLENKIHVKSECKAIE